MFCRALAITEKCDDSRPPCSRFSSAGISLRLVRSPDAPKITITHGSAGGGGACDGASVGAGTVMVDIHELQVAPHRALLRCWVVGTLQRLAQRLHFDFGLLLDVAAKLLAHGRQHLL